MIMLMTASDSIRDVIAFPKTQTASCLLTNAPGKVAQDQIDELHSLPWTRKGDLTWQVILNGQISNIEKVDRMQRGKDFLCSY